MVGKHTARPSRGGWPRDVLIGGLIATLAGIAVGIGVAAFQPDAAAPPSAHPTATSGTQTSESPGTTPEPSAVASPTPTEPTIPTVTFSVVAAGDVLTHTPVLASARSGKGYDFSEQFDPTSPFVKAGDIALCHLEVPVAPKGTAPSGYPMFGAPLSIVRDLKGAGWDGCSTASNHSVDRGFDGIVATLNEFEKRDMGHAGTARSEDESTQVQFYNVIEGSRTVKVAHISYAYGLNGLPKPDGKPWSVNVFDASAVDVSPILDAAEDAREKGADIVISSVHCCVEYVTQPTSTQSAIVEEIAESGLVDLYIGHHAHVPQPISRVAGGPGGKGMWAAYGLGNFISNQDSTTVGVAESASGLMMTATFTVSPDDDVDVGVQWTAVTVDRTGSHIVYPITKSSGKAGNLSASTVKSRWQLVADAVGDEAEELKKPGAPSAESVEISTRTK